LTMLIYVQTSIVHWVSDMTDTLRYLPVTVHLQVPVKLDGKKVSELIMRAPATSDVILAQKSTTSPEDKDVALYAALTDTTEALIRALTLFDYIQLDNAFELFLVPLSTHLELHALLSDENPVKGIAELLSSLSTS